MIKKMCFAWCLVLMGLAMSACRHEPNSTASSSEPPAAARAGKEDPRLVEEVKTVLQKHDQALRDQNIDALMATFAIDPRTVVLGTGKGERYVGLQSIKEEYTERFKNYDPNTLVTNCDWKTGGVDFAGTTAWVAATCPANDSLKNVKREYLLNVSAALRRDEHDWHFIMLHVSRTPTTSSAKP